METTDPGVFILNNAEMVEENLRSLLNAGKNVILVMHSYGGQVGSQATGHLLSTTTYNNHKLNNKGKVLHLFYVAAIIPFEGETGMELGALISAFDEQSDAGSAFLQLLDEVGNMMVCREGIKDIFYYRYLGRFLPPLYSEYILHAIQLTTIIIADLDNAVRNKYYEMLQGMPAALSTTATTHSGWKNIPSTYVYALHDSVIPLQAQICFVDRANNQLSTQANATDGAVGGRNAARPAANLAPANIRTAKIDSDHCSIFIRQDHVQKLADILIADSSKV